MGFAQPTRRGFAVAMQEVHTDVFFMRLPCFVHRQTHKIINFASLLSNKKFVAWISPFQGLSFVGYLFS
jgi:hypothetical protein